LQVHSIREVCLGAAEYCSGRSDLDFDPWPIRYDDPDATRHLDFRRVNGILAAGDIAFALPPRPSGSRQERVFFLTNGKYPGTPCVELDEMAIGRMAAEHLILRGYRQLAFIGSACNRWSMQRGRGFEQRAQQAGIKVARHDLSVRQLPIYWSSCLERCQAELSRIIAKLPMPCGVFAANDVIACFIIETARQCARRVPQQVGVIGVDDDPVPNAGAGLAITSVQTPFREVGRQAAARLDAQLRGHATGRARIVLPPVRVVVRASTDVFMVADPIVRRAQAFIEDKRGGRVFVRDVARAVGVTTVTLDKRFLRRLHLTPSAYSLQRRLEYAGELLRAGELNVEEAAAACGFHNCSYFCMIFRRLMGTTPGRIRMETRRPQAG
jgi:LacI family transcriptional regulator